LKLSIKTLCVIIVVAVLGLVVYIFITGGIHYTSDVSGNEGLWGGYQYQKNYKLLRDVFLKRSSQGMAPWGRLVLVPEASLKGHPGRHESSPESIAVYEANPQAAVVRDLGDFKYKIDVVGIVRRGTRLRTIRLDKHKGFSWFFGYVEDLTPYAEILDGEYAGKVVDITDISIYYRKKRGEGIFMYRPEEGVIALSDK
jgi:hypothetical protein